LAGLAAGAAPLLLYNILQPLATALASGHMTGAPGHLRRLDQAFGQRWEHTLAMLTGAAGWTTGGLEPRRADLQAALTAGAGLAAYVWGRRDGPALRHAGFWLALAGLVFCLAALSPLPVKSHHMYVLYPFPYLAAAALAAGAGRTGPRLLGSLLALGLAGLVLSQTRLLRADFPRQMSQLGGLKDQAHETIAGAAGWLEERHKAAPEDRYLVDSDLRGRLWLLTSGRIELEPLMLSDAPDARGAVEWDRKLADLLTDGRPGETLAVVELDKQDGTWSLSRSRPRLKARGLEVALVHQVAHKDGTPWIGMLAVRASRGTLLAAKRGLARWVALKGSRGQLGAIAPRDVLVAAALGSGTDFALKTAGAAEEAGAGDLARALTARLRAAPLSAAQKSLLAERLLAQGQGERGLELLRAAAAQSGSAESLLGLAAVRLARGDRVGAAASLRDAARSLESASPRWLDLASLAHRAADDALARSALERVGRHAAGPGESVVAASIWADLAEPGRALALLRGPAAALAPRDPARLALAALALRCADPDLAKHALLGWEAALASERKRSAGLWFDVGTRLLALSRAGEAREAFARARTGDAGLAESIARQWLESANAAARAGDRAAALGALVEAGDDLPPALARRAALIRQEAGDPEGALRLLLKQPAPRARAAQAALLTDIGVCEAGLGRKREAVAHLEQALALDPANKAATLTLEALGPR
jgi:tetratricopeptide (TPR) repeat protein